MTTAKQISKPSDRVKGLQVPEFTDPYEKRTWMLQHMAGVLRVFGRKGYNEGCAGHLTIVDPVDPTTYWINPIGVHFSMISVSDLVHVDANGEAIGGSMAGFNVPGFKIHSTIHKARPDVKAICHAHSFYARTYSVFGKVPEMLHQDSCSIHDNIAVLDDYDGVGLDEREGEKILSVLGDKMSIVLQNHGVMTFGKTIDEAGYLHVLLEDLCKAQLLTDAAAVRTGAKIKVIPDHIAREVFKVNSGSKSLYSAMQPDFELEVYLSNEAVLR
ncbi:LADA_0B06392g1_1 [Lachancea dasiensis]|uniref:LADA_0B06392g1_1 n=1 Tax=Lachancea dasiensis TaxID=1072105 RepID=A0A1G4ITK6_9SACH|nr:LADA_0B06392g1_1 [Lachancea dasiensis]